MDNTWLTNKKWIVRDNTTLSAILDKGDTFSLVPNTTSGTPLFYTIQYSGGHTCWKDRYFYSVGVNAPQILLKDSWDDTKQPDEQPAVRDEYNAVGRMIRSEADNPYTARLEGHVLVETNWAIIRLFCFQKAQPSGNDWFAIDSMYSGLRPLQDGTAHGDPH